MLDEIQYQLLTKFCLFLRIFFQKEQRVLSKTDMNIESEILCYFADYWGKEGAAIVLREMVLPQENTMKLDLSPHTIHKKQSRWIKNITVNVTIVTFKRKYWRISLYHQIRGCHLEA